MSSPHNSAPHNSSPDNSTPDDATPDNSVPDNSTPDNSTPDNSAPDNSTPDNSTPNNSTPDKSAPHNSTPDNATPDNSTPDNSNGSHKSSSVSPPSMEGQSTPTSGKDSLNKSLSNEKSSGSNNDSSDKAAMGAGIGVGFVLLVLLIVCFIWSCRKKKRKQKYYYPDPSHGKASNYYNSGQHPLPSWQAGNSGPHGGDHVMRVHQQQMGMGNGMGGMDPHSGGWGAPPHMMNSGEIMSSNYSLGMSSSSPGLSLALNANGGTFTYEELAAATKGFANENIIGQGGFGYVHKGILPNGKEVAVKSLKAGSGQGEREFQAEIDIISRVHHRHLVSLVGYSICGDQRMLVYEFVPNSTLEHHLHGKGMPTMDWPTRMKIALGSAKGLAYLHEDCSPRIIHRDIKASNVLLDQSFEAKVSDFGLAKLTNDTNTHVSTRVMGTFGYLAPEYASSGKLTEKSDVFSFGVMLLELITGKRPVDLTNAMEDSLVDWARPLLNKGLEDGNFGELVDPFLEGKYNPQEMTRMAACAAGSIRHSARKRSKMSQIVRALEGEASLDELKDGMKLKGSGNGNSSAHTSSAGSSEYDTMQYKADMIKFRQAIMSSQEFNDSSELSSKEMGYH